MIGRRRPAVKQPYKCVDGPWRGTTLYLFSAGTLPIKYKGMEGRYVVAGHRELIWEPLN